MGLLSLFNKFKWKYVGYLFLGCSLSITFFINLLVRGKIERGEFDLFCAIVSLIFIIPFLFKVFITIRMLIMASRIKNSALKQNLIAELAHNHSSNATPKEIIVENMIKIIKAMCKVDANTNVKFLEDSLMKARINNTEYDIGKFIVSEKNDEILSLFLEVELLVEEEMKIEEIEKMINLEIKKEFESEGK